MPDERRRTPAGGVGVRVGAEDDTPQIRPIARAIRDTQQSVKNSADRVETLRTELGGRIDKLDGKVDDLAVCSARVEGQVGVLVDELQAARQIRVGAAMAYIEVEKTGEIAKVNEAVAVRADRRQLALKVLAFAGPIVAAIMSYLIARC